MHYFWNVKQIDFETVKTMWNKWFFLKQFWSFVPFPSAFDFMFLLLVVIALLQILSRSAICTVHFRSIWTAPLRFSTCRSWAGSKVTAAKLDPKKSKFHLPNWMFKCVFFTFFSHFFLSRFFFTFFSKCIFKTHFFHIFSKRIFKTLFFKKHFLHFCETCENMQNNCVLKMRLETHVNKCVLNMWKTCE